MERDYEVSIFVDGMQSPLIDEVVIVAETAKEAKEWVMENMRLEVKAL